MSEFPSDIRIGDTEREQALKALGEHMSAGRINLDEYGERSAKITAAKTRSELLGLFADLPEPRPKFGPPLPIFDPPVARPPAPRWNAALVPAIGLLAVVLFFIVKNPFILAIIPLAAILIGSLNGRRR